MYKLCTAVLFIGFSLHFYQVWIENDSRLAAVRSTGAPSSCLKQEALTWFEWYTSPSEETRRIQCQQFWTELDAAKTMPNPVLEAVSFSSLIAVQPIKTVIFSMATYYLTLVAQFGSVSVYVTILTMVVTCTAWYHTRKHSQYDASRQNTYLQYRRAHQTSLCDDDVESGLLSDEYIQGAYDDGYAEIRSQYVSSPRYVSGIANRRPTTSTYYRVDQSMRQKRPTIQSKRPTLGRLPTIRSFQSPKSYGSQEDCIITEV